MDWVGLTAIIAPIVTGAGSWLAATRMRRNSAIRSLQETINQLAEDNKKYVERITELQSQLADIKAANAELKAGQAAMERKIDELKSENKRLGEILKNNTKPRKNKE